MTRRILITGGAGSLGTNFLDRQAERGSSDAHLVLDNFATSGRDALGPDGEGLEVVRGSVADSALVAAVFDRFRPTHVLHAAASYKDPDDYGEDGLTNVVGTQLVLAAAERVGVSRFVNLQTALCYGRPDSVPIPITAPLRPFTSYGVSKTAGEQIVLRSDLSSVSLRLANVTGPRLSIGPIPTFYTRLKAGKACFCSATIRDFLDMEDFLDLLDLALAHDAPTGPFNVSTGQGRSIKDVFDVVSAHLGAVPIEPPPIVAPASDDVAEVVLDPSATEQAFGWTAKVSFKDSLRRMLDWYDVNGVRAVYAHLKAPGSTGGQAS